MSAIDPADGRARETRWFRRRSSFALLLLGLVIGAVIGAATQHSTANQELERARSTIRDEKSDARTDIAGERRLALANVTKTRRQLRRDIHSLRVRRTSARGLLATERSDLRAARRRTARAEATLSRLRQEASGVRAEIAKNSFDGEGTYLVGSDISPGTYRAEPSEGCYWARLSSLNTSDIIDNDNADGPVVISVLPSDKALQVSGCGEFRKAAG